MSSRLLRTALVLALATPLASADEVRGLRLVREAQASLAGGEVEDALAKLNEARVEWPGSPVVAHTMGDALHAQGSYLPALAEYEKGAAEPHSFRSYFNQGVTRNDMTEAKLEEAGVPLDPMGLPEQVSPQPLIEAIDDALPQLYLSRSHFLQALGLDTHAGAQESVAALNRRIDDLKEMKEELEKRLQEQEQENDEEGEDEQEQEQEQEEQDEGEQGEDEQDQDGQQDDQEQQEQEQPQPDEPQEEEGEGDEQQDPADVPPPTAEPMVLTPEQVQELLEQLEELEERAIRMQQARRAAERQSVEKDW